MESRWQTAPPTESRWQPALPQRDEALTDADRSVAEYWRDCDQQDDARRQRNAQQAAGQQPHWWGGDSWTSWDEGWTAGWTTTWQNEGAEDDHWGGISSETMKTSRQSYSANDRVGA